MRAPTRLVAVDAETFLIQPGDLQPKPVVFSFAEVGAAFLELPNAAALRLADLLRDENVKLIGQNVAFDLGVLVKWYPHLMPLVFAAYEAGRIADTKIRQQLIDIAEGCLNRARKDGTQGYSLADLEHHYLGRLRYDEKTDPNAWRLRYQELAGVPLEQWPEAARRYALADATGTLEVYEAQAECYGPIASEADQMRAAWALHLMSCHGIRTDGRAIAELEARLKAEREKNHELFLAAGFLKAGPLSAEDRRKGKEAAFFAPRAKDPKGLGPRPMKWTKNQAVIKARVEKAYAGRSVPLTESGATSMDRDTLEASRDPILETLGASSIVDKLLGTYVPALQQGMEHRVCTRFNVLVNNGRTSSHKDRATGEGFNFQNFPRSDDTDADALVNLVRPCVVPSEGTYFCSVDLDGGELRSLAQVQLWLFGRSTLAEEIRAKKDPLLVFAAQLLGIPYEEAARRKKAGDPAVKQARGFGKVYHYGKAGGLGVASTIDYAWSNYRIRMTEDQVREYDRIYFRQYPEMRMYFDYVSRLVGEGDVTIKSFGNGMVRGGAGYTDTCNHFFSNLVAQGAKEACFRVSKECYVDCGTPLFGCRPVAFIHDEILAEIPKDQPCATQAAYRLAEIVCATVAERIPDVPITASPALMERWHKAAEPKHDAAGFLVPWSLVARAA